MLDKVSLLSYMVQGHVHLSRKDYGFFHNVKTIIQDKNPITSNQAKLFDKLIQKYQRQLEKLGYKYETLSNLPWKCEIVDTRPEFLEAKVYLYKDKILVKSPFNTNFIKEFRKVTQGVFDWDKQKRLYQGNYSTYNLKVVLDCVSKHYDTVSYCKEINLVLSEMESYKNCKFWTPTLVKCNDRYIVAAMNENLNTVLEGLNFDNDPKTLFQLSQYGVKIDDSVLTDDLSRFASEFFTSIDLDKLDTYASYLKKMYVDSVVLTRDLLYTKEISKEIKSIFSKHNIETLSLTEHNGDDTVLVNYRLRISHDDSYKYKASKIVSITNSRPVVVK